MYNDNYLVALNYASINLLICPRIIFTAVNIVTKFNKPSVIKLNPKIVINVLSPIECWNISKNPNAPVNIAVISMLHHLLMPKFFESMAIWIFNRASARIYRPKINEKTLNICSVWIIKIIPSKINSIPQAKSYWKASLYVSFEK